MSRIFPIIPAPDKTLWVIGAIITLFLLFNILFGYLAYSSHFVKFELSPQGLRITGDIYGTKIAKDSLKIDEVLIINLRENKPYQPKWRTNGVGLPGYLSGWFRLNNKEKALLFVTDQKNVVYLPTNKGYSVMMSMKQPEEFVRILQEEI
jgi:hypothetical protein